MIVCCYWKRKREMEDGIADGLPDSMLLVQAVNVLRSRLHKGGLAISISGIDGSGKSTLARHLVHALEASGVPTRYLHLYQWYRNVLTTPIQLLYNRYFGRKLLVFDRSIYDNIAVVSMRHRCPRWLSNVALSVVLACHPKFDYRLYLVVAFDETLRRRPDTCENRFIVLSRIYDEIAYRAQYVRMRSDAHLFTAVLRNIVVGA